MRSDRTALAAALLLLAGCSTQRLSFMKDDHDDARKKWKEAEAKLPPYPKAENLVPLEGSPASGHKFYVDAPSVAVGEDGVVRYTLVVKTAGGATDVSFEGIRCETRQLKYYAIGRSNGTWSLARDPEWRRIESDEINRQHVVLYADYFCDGKAPVKNAGVALDALKYGRPSAP